MCLHDRSWLWNPLLIRELVRTTKILGAGFSDFKLSFYSIQSWVSKLKSDNHLVFKMSNKNVFYASVFKSIIIWKFLTNLKICMNLELEQVQVLFYPLKENGVNPILLGYLKTRIRFKSHVWCPRMTNDTSLDSSFTLLCPKNHKIYIFE